MLYSKELAEYCLKHKQKQFDLVRCIQALVVARAEITDKQQHTQEAHIDNLLEEYTVKLESLSGLYN